jgi:hypothetical protein
MADMTIQTHQIPLADALKAMPMETPATSSLQMVMAALPNASGRFGKTHHRKWPRYAMACGLSTLLFITIFFNARQASQKNEASPTPQLEHLMQQSAQLENILLSTRRTLSSDANIENWQIEIDQQLQHIDQRLSENVPNSEQQTALWQARIDALKNANLLGVKQNLHAAEGNYLQVALVETY